MNFDNSFPNRVAISRVSLGLTQAELARKVGVVSRQIAAYEGGEAKPRPRVLSNLAAALGTTTEWLARGIGSGPDISSVKRTIVVREIPVLTHIHASFGSLDKLLKTAAVKDFIPSPSMANEECFAVEIQGDSMTSAEGISFPSGSIVTFDSSLEATSGDFVLCSLESGFESIFKQLILDQGRAYLKSLNPDYPMIAVDNKDMKVAGVAIHTQFIINRSKISNHSPHDEVEKLVGEANRVSQDFWTKAKFDSNTHLDERLNRLDEIAERLEKIVEKNLKENSRS